MTQNRWILFAVLSISFFGPFMASSINIAIPAMGKDFELMPEQLSWVVTAFLVGSAAFLVPFGKLADIVGSKRLFCIGLRFLLAATVAGALSPDAFWLILFRLLQGVSLAMIFSTSMAMLVASHPPAQRGRVIGYSAAATYIGLSLGPVVGGLMTQFLGWRLIFWCMAGGILLSLLAMGTVEGEWYGEPSDRLDYIGSLLYSLSAGLLLYGLSSYGTYPFAGAFLAAGVIFFILFLWEQYKAEYPLINWQLFRSGIFAFSNLAAMIHYSSTFALGFILSLYLQLLRGFDAAFAGLFLLLQPVMMAAFSPLAGSLSDKKQPRLVASSGMAMTALGLAVFLLMDENSSLFLIGGNLLFIGVGFAFFSSPNSNAIMGSVSSREYGIAAAVLSVMRIGGQAISMAIVTVILTTTTASVPEAEYLPSLMQVFHRVFAVFAVLCSLGVFISLARGRRPIKSE